MAPGSKPVYENDRLKVDFQTFGLGFLEISFFDSCFRDGLRLSGYLLPLLGLLLAAGRVFRNEPKAKTHSA